MPDVVLTAALRNNLLSLNKTQSAIDLTQFRLATGRKVNSALDNPQSFFAAQSLNNRASDLTRLLDGLGQNIQAIKAADNGVTALTKLVEQADSVAQQARDALSSGQAEAKITGTVNLSDTDDLTSMSGIANTDTLSFAITDPDGVIATTTATVTINANDSIEELITEINDIRDANSNRVIEAKLDDSGQLEIKSLNGGDLQIDFNSNAATTVADRGLAQALGFGTLDLDNYSDADIAAGAVDEVRITASANAALVSTPFFESGDNTVAERGDLLSTIQDSTGANLFAGDTGDDILIAVDGGTQIVAADLGTDSIQDLVDNINTNASVNQLIQADYDDQTGEFSIRAIDSSVSSIQIGVRDDAAGAAASANFGFGAIGALTSTDASNDSSTETILLGSAASELAELESEYNNIRAQIDSLVQDTGYRGTNLLNGDDLTSFFNEDRTGSLVTEGVTFTADGLGITAGNFARTATVDAALTQSREALTSVRNFGSTLSNDLAIIQTRQDFTSSTINNLKEGSDKLTIADQNEEGANLLSLQTRQQLGVTSLALASQSQQSVLRLF